MSRAIPNCLYKYRSFSNRTLDSLIADELFFADPSTFNDPLDTKPTVDADIDVAKLEIVLQKLAEFRIAAEMNAAAKKLKTIGPKTLDHISRISRQRVARILDDIRYNSTDPDYEVEDPQKFLLCHYIEEELLKRYGKGILALAEKADCPLMWSHYGDQHHGVCIGYAVPKNNNHELYKVRYGGSRLIKASLLEQMLTGDPSAEREVDKAVLSKKASNWKYEREWRLVAPRGLQPSPLELKEIVFGMRCTSTVKYTVVKALERHPNKLKFYEIRERRGQFLLGKYVLEIDELLHSYPKRSLDIEDFFTPL